MALVDRWIWGYLQPQLPLELRLVCMEITDFPNLLHVYEKYGIVEVKWGFYAYINTELRWIVSYIASWNVKDDSLVYLRDHHAKDVMGQRRDADAFVEDLSNSLKYQYYSEDQHCGALLEGLDAMHALLEKTGSP